MLQILAQFYSLLSFFLFLCYLPSLIQWQLPPSHPPLTSPNPYPLPSPAAQSSSLPIVFAVIIGNKHTKAPRLSLTPEQDNIPLLIPDNASVRHNVHLLTSAATSPNAPLMKIQYFHIQIESSEMISFLNTKPSNGKWFPLADKEEMIESYRFVCLRGYWFSLLQMMEKKWQWYE